jgi:hypothetical protein
MAKAPKISAQPVPTQSGPAVRLYKVSHPMCPAAIVEAYSPDEAAGIYRQENRLNWQREVYTEVVEHGGSR